ncbi:11215_t:CDS:10 [Funneliformis mosseae]|uniref:11215_t:CDS:1 n=1 Tax=Funneliformis mosseae TaxID=27381 RepID=A0A9N9GQ79_FUNMO|nr:11215_t:CDS:10 [Funneliformis mosseae]
MSNQFPGYDEINDYFKIVNDEQCTYYNFLKKFQYVILNAPPYTDDWTGIDGVWYRRYSEYAKKAGKQASWVDGPSDECKHPHAPMKSFFEEIIMERKKRTVQRNYISSSIYVLDKSREIGEQQLILDLYEAAPSNIKRSQEDEVEKSSKKSKSIINNKHEEFVFEQKDLDVNESHDKNEFDNVDLIDLIDEEGELFFGITELSLIQEKVQKAIDNCTDELQIKLLKWQQHMLKKLESGTHCPTSQNIHKLLATSSVFYFQQKVEHAYIDFLTPYEIAAIKSLVNSDFEQIGTSDDIKLFVKENKKKFRRDALEELETYIKECSINQNGCINKTFFKLLEEYVLWNPLIDMKKLNESIYIVDYLGPIFNKTIHYFNYVTTHSWISVESKASKLRKSPADGRIPDYMLHNQKNTRTSVFLEVTSPKREDEEKKINWNIYRASIHAKDAIDYDIKKFNIQPSSGKKLAIFINGYKMVVCVMKLQYPGIYLMVEVANCTIPNSVRQLESIMKLHQTLISIKENAIDYLEEDGYSTPTSTNYLDWINPTATTPIKNIYNNWKINRPFSTYLPTLQSASPVGHLKKDRTTRLFYQWRIC